MKLIPTLALLGALTTVSGVAAAANPTGPYIGAGIGQFNMNVDDFDDIDNAISDVADSDDNSWKIFAGYRVMPFLALEAAYIDLGKPGGDFNGTSGNGNYRAEISGFAPAALGIVPIGPIEAFAKAGWYFYDIDLNLETNGTPSVSGSDSDDGFMWGLGASIVLLEHLELRAEYERIDIRSAKDSDAFWLTAAWRF